MKRSKRSAIIPAALAIGVLLGRSAQAATDNTTLTFGGGSNINGLTTFGSGVSSSSSDWTITGIGTPNLNLAWSLTPVGGGGGGGGNNIEWDYYTGGPWSAAQLNNSKLGNFDGSTTLPHVLTFTPQSGFAVAINSFNFQSYYNNGLENFAYNWTVKNGASTLASGSISFGPDALKHAVSIGYTGLQDQVLSLELLRTTVSANGPGGFDTAFNIAVDDISFGQVAVPEPGGFAMISGGLASLALFGRRRLKRPSGA